MNDQKENEHLDPIKWREQQEKENPPVDQKWNFPLNKWGQPYRKDLLLLMIAEAWDRGDFKTQCLEDQYHEEEMAYNRPIIYGRGGHR